MFSNASRDPVDPTSELRHNPSPTGGVSANGSNFHYLPLDPELMPQLAAGTSPIL